MNFVVVRSPSPYNGIIGRPKVWKIQAVPSIAHGMLKFPVSGGIVTLRSSKLIPLKCMIVSGPEVQPSAITRVVEERMKVAIHPEYPEQTIAIGSTLTEDGRKDETQAERSRRMSPSQIEEKKPSTRKKQGNTRGSRKTYGSRHHEGSSLSQQVVKSDNGKKARRQLEDVCGL
ncbi:hypothetical protein Tco_1070249 [Tanacetum coccineum]|uniref:Reverse transcriptase domain-containing protein n=1 Tax=Tanacetum coccineum TaxID=301880 RepID=A0ABQ5HKS6_9ASTR